MNTQPVPRSTLERILLAAHGGYVWYDRPRFRLFLWHPGDPHVTVMWEANGEEVETFPLTEGAPLTADTARTTITERLNAGH